MADHHDHERATTGERVRHWLVVTTLTFLGLLVAELPVLSQTRDRVYLWLQERLVRSHKTVVVVAIDDEEFWRGELRGARPLNRVYLARLLNKIADGNPAAIGLDVGLEVNTPDVRPEWRLLTDDEKTFLSTVDDIARRYPVILPRTISGSEHLVSRYDLFDAITFSDDAIVAHGHTSSARDPRQIPTRVMVDDRHLVDSFAVAVFREVTREVPAKLDDPNHAWPYSFFLPKSTFVPKKAPVGRDGLLTAGTLLSASPAQAKSWLERQVVLIGGTWRVDPHDGSDFADAHRTPVGTLPGVVVHANYVQSLLWDAMYAMPRAWRLGLEIVLALAISVGFLIAHGWHRLVLVIGTLITVVLLTWVFSSAIGVFFDMVVPVAFLGVHALWEQSSEKLRLDFKQKFQYAEHVFSSVAVVAVLITGFFFVRHEIHAKEKQLVTEDRLQVTDLKPLPQPDGDAREEVYAQKSPEADKTPPPPPDLPKPRPDEQKAQKAPVEERPHLRQRRIVPEQPRPLIAEDQQTQIVVTSTQEEPKAPSPEAIEQRAADEADDLRTQIEMQQRTIDMGEIEEERRIAMEMAKQSGPIRLVDARPNASGLFAWSRIPSLSIVIDHKAQVATPTQVIAFVPPQGPCAEELTDSLTANFAASGSLVYDRTHLKQVMAEHKLSSSGAINNKTARVLKSLIGASSLIFIKVHECKNFNRAEATHGKIKASIQIVDASTGVTSAARVIDTEVRTDRDDVERSWSSLAGARLKAAMKTAPSNVLVEEETRRKVVAEAAAQMHHLVVDWPEKVKIPFFDDKVCALDAAFLRLRQGDVEGAGRAAQASVDLCTGTSGVKQATLARALYNRGVTHLLAGDLPNALTHLRHALLLGPNKVVFSNAVALCERLSAEKLLRP